jgi:predicted ATPase
VGCCHPVARAKRPRSDPNLSATPPLAPEVLCGRDEIVAHHVRLLTSPTSTKLAIMGTGGIGKTSVALAILHHEDVVKAFSDQRFFLSAEAMLDAESLVEGLATMFGVRRLHDPLTAVLRHLKAQQRTLIILDNLETIWNDQNAAVRSKTERVLHALAEVPTVSLIITARGIILPDRINWANARNASLDPLSWSASNEAFNLFAGPSTGDCEESARKELLMALGGLPLAISLVARLARRGYSSAFLLNRWRDMHADMLRTHSSGRLDNVRVSINVLLPRGDSEPLRLLSTGGISPRVCENPRSGFQDM